MSVLGGIQFRAISYQGFRIRCQNSRVFCPRKYNEMYERKTGGEKGGQPSPRRGFRETAAALARFKSGWRSNETSFSIFLRAHPSTVSFRLKAAPTEGSTRAGLRASRSFLSRAELLNSQLRRARQKGKAHRQSPTLLACRFTLLRLCHRRLSFHFRPPLAKPVNVKTNIP